MRCLVLGLAGSHELNYRTFTKLHTLPLTQLNEDTYMRQTLIKYYTASSLTLILKGKWRNFLICFEISWQFRGFHFLWVLVGSVTGLILIILLVVESNPNFHWAANQTAVLQISPFSDLLPQHNSLVITNLTVWTLDGIDRQIPKTIKFQHYTPTL